MALRNWEHPAYVLECDKCGITHDEVDEGLVLLFADSREALAWAADMGWRCGLNSALCPQCRREKENLEDHEAEIAAAIHYAVGELM